MFNSHVSFPDSGQRLELNEARSEVGGLRQSLKEGEGEREKELEETAGLHQRHADREVWPQYISGDLSPWGSGDSGGGETEARAAGRTDGGTDCCTQVVEVKGGGG